MGLIPMKTKIQNQFFLYYLFLAVIPLLALSYYSYYTIKTNAQKSSSIQFHSICGKVRLPSTLCI